MQAEFTPPGYARENSNLPPRQVKGGLLLWNAEGVEAFDFGISGLQPPCPFCYGPMAVSV